MVLQYKRLTRYICNYHRQQMGVPVCQFIPSPAVDQVVINAFFQALSAISLNTYEAAIESNTEKQFQIEKAHRQEIERLRYQAQRAERQFNHADPENRLVTAELEKRWENALETLKRAEDRYQKQITQKPAPALPRELKQAFLDIGQRLPGVWHHEALTDKQRKAFIRSLIDKVVVHRLQRDQLQIRIVWKGGESTTLTTLIAVQALREMNNVDDIAIGEIFQKAKPGGLSTANPPQTCPSIQAI